MNEFDLFLSFFVPLVASLVLVPLVIKAASFYEIFDLPEGDSASSESWRKIHKFATPALGGVAILPAFLSGVFWSQDWLSFLPIVLVSMIIFLTGLADDLKNLTAKKRILIQLLCAALVVWCGDLSLIHISVHSSFVFDIPKWFGFFLSVFVIIGAINATNMSDGLDGLAAGLVVICLVFISFCSYLFTADFQLWYLTLPALGATLGFLRYNTHPASIFMGDGGSNWLGFILGVATLLLLLQEPAGSAVGTYAGVPFLTAFMGLSLPVIDTTCVILARLKQGKSPMSADKNHFHHTLMKIGFTHPQTVVAIYFMAMLFSVSGLVSIAYPPPHFHLWWVSYVAVFVVLGVVLIGQFLGSNKRLFLQNRSWLASSRSNGSRVRITIRYWEKVNTYILYLVLLIISVFANHSAAEIGYVALTASALVLLSLLGRQHRSSDFLDSLALVVGLGVLLFATNQDTLYIEWLGKRISIQTFYNNTFVFLFISSILFILSTMRKRYLFFTPSDFLVIFVPLLLLLLPASVKSTYLLNSVSLRCLIFFIVLRTFAKRKRRSVYHMKVIVFFSLLYLVCTNIFGFKIL